MIPCRAEDFTVDWLNSALTPVLDENRVTGCNARLSDIPGQTAEVVLLDVEYANPTDLPTSMVAKIKSFNQVVLDNVIANYDQYRRETSFYREFPDIGISVPRCLFEAHDPQTHDLVLLMADLAPAESPSWAITPEQVEVALAALPAFHARWWNHPTLREKDWMVQYDNHGFFEIAFHAAAGAADTLRELYGADAEPSIALMAKSVEKFDRITRFIASRPFTFVHGDYHAKQMFFPSQTGGEFAVIDWQFPFVAQGAWDFARMAGMCLQSSVLEASELRLFDAYIKGLQANGISYSKEDLELDYCMGLDVSQMIMSIAHGDTDPSLFEAECGALGVDWRDAMLLRTQRAIENHDVLGFIDSL